MKVVTIQTKIPQDEIRRGKYHDPESISSFEVAEITRHAHVLSAKDPNKSEPMPAMSPTLSPTLSAITPGLKGLSSGSPCTTFPARSDPTSAALV
jgi:hypothetical protein